MRKVLLGSLLCLTIGASAAVADPPRERAPLFLRFTVVTGNDDLRGGHDSVRASVIINGVETRAYLLNQRGQRWADRSTHETTIPLPPDTYAGHLQKVVMTATFRGGIDGDNWNMQSVRIDLTDSSRRMYFPVGSHGFKRFTGSDQRLEIPLNLPAPSPVRK